MHRGITYHSFLKLLCLGVILFGETSPVFAQEAGNTKSADGKPVEVARLLTLKKAVMCEDVKEYLPTYPAVVFPISLGKVMCFTSFDPVPQKTIISHYWYRRDTLSHTTRLELHPPKWSTFSMIQLRETDRGPWRVEIVDENGKILQTLRFSIAGG